MTTPSNNVEKHTLYLYHNASGKPVLGVKRTDRIGDDGLPTKTILQCAVNEDGTIESYGLPQERKTKPLYNLPLIANKSFVLLVEGEKTCEAAKAFLPDGNWCVTTWSGGTSGVSSTDFSPLAGKTIVMWPDNDGPGRFAANILNGKILSQLGCKVHVIQSLSEYPESWDLADELPQGVTPEKIKKKILSAAKKAKIFEMPMPEQPDSLPMLSNVHSIEDAKFLSKKEIEVAQLNPNKKQYYRPLGYRDDILFLLCRETGNLKETSIKELSRIEGLLTICQNREYWDDDVWDTFALTDGRGDGAKPDYSMIAAQIAKECIAEGFYEPENKFRGRGCWWEGDNLVVHLGHCLLVAGEKKGHFKHETKYIYSIEGKLLDVSDDVTPLSNNEGIVIMNACAKANWRNEIYGSLYAGWLVVSMLAGTLDWRPHIWVTGNKGSGKSQLCKQVARRVLGSVALYVQGSTTEAGLRGYLGYDSRPVCFDEAEGQSNHTAQGMLKIIELIRASSSDNSGTVIKGTAQGGHNTYETRCMFYLSSIGDTLKLGQDRQRVTVLNLKSASEIEDVHEREQRYADFVEAARDLDGIQNIPAKLLKRLITHIELFKTNHKIFVKECTRYFGEGRYGDQIGTLLAGRWILTNDRLVTPEAVREILKRHNWEELKSDFQVMPEDEEIINYILSADIKCELSDGRIGIRKVAELLQHSRGDAYAVPNIKAGRADAETALERNGIKIVGDKVRIANTESGFANELMAGTPYEHSWVKILRRHKAAESSRKYDRFAGFNSTFIEIPIDSMLVDEGTPR